MKLRWRHSLFWILPSVLVVLLMSFAAFPLAATPRHLGIPAEWEPHAATWLQWPGPWEFHLRPDFARIISIIQAYEPVHLLVSSARAKKAAQAVLQHAGVQEANLTWHIVSVDNAWMRDNGPVFLQAGGKWQVQDWGFDAWGGNFGSEVDWANDDRVPGYVSEYLDLRLEDRSGYVLERGNLEVNGAGVALMNWDCQAHRNPGMNQAAHEAILKQALGLSRLIWAYGHDPTDKTTGHIDGIARFIRADTVAIAAFAETIGFRLASACVAAGLQVVWFDGDVNWLVGNGFVLAAASGDGGRDAANKALLTAWFPGRAIHLVDVAAIQAGGGGIHCVTNDQPSMGRPIQTTP